MSASEAGTVTGTAMLWILVLVVAIIMGVSLYKRVAKPKDKHMNPIAYGVLFIVGLLFILGQILTLVAGS